MFCSRFVLSVLWQYSRAQLDICDDLNYFGKKCPVMRFVDVGANMGDCQLSAAALLPQGTFRGLALDADPYVVSALRESVVLNGWHGVAPNESKVIVRHVALSSSRSLASNARVNMDIGMAYRGAISPIRATASKPQDTIAVRVSTLDRELSNFSGVIQLLTVFINGYEAQALLGAEATLRAGRVRCLMIKCLDGCLAVKDLTVLSEYKVHDAPGSGGGWLAASPWILLRESGAQVCSPSLLLHAR